MTGPERVIETYLRRQVEKRGGWCLKFVPLKAGNPDRLVILPKHPVYLVETKAPGGRIRPIQKVWHVRAAKKGHTVYVLPTKEAVDEWLARVDAGRLS